jgi:hypothetical protein
MRTECPAELDRHRRRAGRHSLANAAALKLLAPAINLPRARHPPVTVDAHNFAKRLEVVWGLTPFECIGKA